MVSLNKKEKGFTIVELLIVIVVIGILAALVIVTFSGVQRRARDSERTTDIGAINSHLEAYHADRGYYPTLGELQDSAAGGFVETNLRGLDLEALHDPKGSAGNNIVGTRAANAYSYAVSPTGCDNTTTECESYVLTAVPEGGGDDVVKNSLN